MARTFILSVLFVSCLAILEGRSETTVETIIAGMSEQMAEIESIHIESMMRVVFDDGENAEEMEQASRFLFRRPDRVFIDADSFVLFNDADAITMAFAHFGYAIQQPIVGSLQDVFSGDDEVFGTMMFPDIAALLSADPAATLQEAIQEFEVTVLPEEEYAGRPAWVVHIELGEVDVSIPDGVRVWIDQETGLVAGLRTTVDLSAEEGFPMMSDVPMGYEIHYTVQVQSLNEPLDDELFAFDLEGYTIVGSMEELMEAFQGGSGAAQDGAIAVGAEAPDFELVLMDESIFRLSDQRGRVVVIDFWATWCPPCVQSLPSLQAMYEELGGEDVEFVGVSLDRPTARNQVEAMMDRFSLTYPIGINADGAIAADYGAASIPTLVVVDREGIVRHVKVGFSEPAMEHVAEVIREWVGEEE